MAFLRGCFKFIGYMKKLCFIIVKHKNFDIMKKVETGKKLYY